MFKNINDLQNNAEKVRDLINNANDLNSRVTELENDEGGESEGGVSATDYLVTFDASLAQSAGENLGFYALPVVCAGLIGASKFDIFPAIPELSEVMAGTLTYNMMNTILCAKYGVKVAYVDTKTDTAGDTQPGAITVALDTKPESETILALTVRVYE